MNREHVKEIRDLIAADDSYIAGKKVTFNFRSFYPTRRSDGHYWTIGPCVCVGGAIIGRRLGWDLPEVATKPEDVTNAIMEYFDVSRRDANMIGCIGGVDDFDDDDNKSDCFTYHATAEMLVEGLDNLLEHGECRWGEIFDRHFADEWRRMMGRGIRNE